MCDTTHNNKYAVVLYNGKENGQTIPREATLFNNYTEVISFKIYSRYLDIILFYSLLIAPPLIFIYFKYI